MRPPYDRVLIVSEGSKTEPLYFEDIRKQNSIPTAHITVLPSELGTEPRQVVDFAEAKFKATGRYERVYAVFDRDDHRTYHDAIDRAAALDRRLKNDEGRPVAFHAIPSVPCFEIWLLLHFEAIYTFWHRTETIESLRRHIPSYVKSATGIYELTEPHLEIAVRRAQHLRSRFQAETGTDPFTKIDEVVEFLRSIRRA